LGVVDILRRSRRWKNPAPDGLSFGDIREGEVDDESEPALESGVQRSLLIAGEDGEAAIGLHALQEVAHLDIGVAVVAVLDFAALAEEGVGLVEEQDRASVLGSVEDPGEVLLGLADVLADHRGEVDAEESEMQLLGQHLRGHGLAGAALALEEGGDAEPARVLAGEAPAIMNRQSVADLAGNSTQHRRLRLGQDEIVPAGRRL